jgi:ACT domain-containing protein
MKQFDLFGGFSKPTKSKNKIRNQGRPKTITPEIVFETKKLLSSKKKVSNDEIMQKLRVSKSTFYRIKKGYYDDLFKRFLESNIQNFSLTQEEK